MQPALRRLYNENCFLNLLCNFFMTHGALVLEFNRYLCFEMFILFVYDISLYVLRVDCRLGWLDCLDWSQLADFVLIFKSNKIN